MLILALLIESCSRFPIMSPRTCLSLFSSSPPPRDCRANEMLQISAALNRGVWHPFRWQVSALTLVKNSAMKLLGCQLSIQPQYL